MSGHYVLAATWALFLAGTGTVCAAGPSPRASTFEFDSERGVWVEQVPPEPGTPDGDLHLARALHAGQHRREALGAVKKWFRVYGEDHELAPQAVLLECTVRVALRDYYDAHVRLQEFLNEFAGTAYEQPALDLEFVIAEVFLSGTKRKLLGMRVLRADDVALSVLDDISVNYPSTRLAELAIMTKADYYFRTGDFPFAEQEYALLVEKFPRSRYVRRAMLQAARSALASFPGIEFDDAPLIEAEERFSRYLAQYPGAAEQEGIGQIMAYIGETRASKEVHVGEYYQRTGRLRAARFYYRSTVEHWPETIAALRAAEHLQAMGTEVDGEGAPAPASETVPDSAAGGT